MGFPDTKYMGSKRALLPFIMRHVSKLEFQSVLDAFSGSACVSYQLKKAGKRVFSNDFLHFAFHTARATVENSATRLTQDDLRLLLTASPAAGTFIRERYAGLYFSYEDCAFLDNLRANIDKLSGRIKQSMALAAACRACMKKRPRGIFTFVGKKGWDGRRDLRLTMAEQFLAAVGALNSAVFSNNLRNKATREDVFELDPSAADLVYIDTPYIGPHSDSDYTRRYHFLEGFCTYWKGCEIQEHTLTKKIPSYPTAFSSRRTALSAFTRLFAHFARCKMVVSYSSNGVPSKQEIISMLRRHKSTVKAYETRHRYCFGNHAHRVGHNNNDVTEYLFVAT
jgi:DNA adenine methylase